MVVLWISRSLEEWFRGAIRAAYEAVSAGFIRRGEGKHRVVRSSYGVCYFQSSAEWSSWIQKCLFCILLRVLYASSVRALVQRSAVHVCVSIFFTTRSSTIETIAPLVVAALVRTNLLPTRMFRTVDAQ